MYEYYPCQTDYRLRTNREDQMYIVLENVNLELKEFDVGIYTMCR
jgi:hypothetical protein